MNDNQIDIYGVFLPQKGPCNCFASIDLGDAFGDATLTLIEFQNIQRSALKFCLERDLNIEITCTVQTDFYEIIGVGQIVYNEAGDAFTAQFTIMGTE